ncbi:MAG: hypothetical protein ABR915_23505 [Thermoguttaceae bacterium]|jgi:hypothetical protein
MKKIQISRADDASAAAADTGSPDTLPTTGIAQAPDVVQFLREREAKATRIVMDAAAGRPVPSDDIEFASVVFGPTFGQKVEHAKAILAADVEVATAAAAVVEHKSEAVRLATVSRNATAAQASISHWAAKDEEQWRTLAWVRKLADDDVYMAGIAAQAHNARAGFAEQKLAAAEARRVALD